MVRPLKNIDWDKVDELLKADCTGVEVAAYFDMHPNTFYDRCQLEKKVRFTEYQAQKRAIGDSFLRKKQDEVALQGNTTMLIWLGKQRLGQKEPDKASLSDQDAQTIVKAIYYADKNSPDSNSNQKVQTKTPKSNSKRSTKKKKPS